MTTSLKETGVAQVNTYMRAGSPARRTPLRIISTLTTIDDCFIFCILLVLIAHDVQRRI